MNNAFTKHLNQYPLLATSRSKKKKQKPVHVYEGFGESKTLSEWSQDPRCMVARPTLVNRLKRLGWTLEEALTTTVEESIKARQHKRKVDKPDPVKVDQSVIYEAFGESKTLKDWMSSPQRLVGTRTVWSRLAAGWDIESALQKPKRDVPNPKAKAITTSCLYCGSLNNRVLRVVQLDWGIRRRKECLDCRQRFTTKTKE